MSSTTVAQHTTQPLNFGPEWLRALSTPDSATSIPSSGGSGNVFKFSATKYRYSKDEILALRANVSERLTETIKNEIIENLKNVENVFRANIMEPLTLTPPTPEETAKMNALSSYISGRTPGGAGRPGNNSQQDSRNIRGGNSTSNGRGGSRGRGGRDHTFGSNRPNNSDDNSENVNTTDETSVPSSWSRGSHSRGGSFGNRMRSFDDREQSQTFRRGSSRQTSEGWRRSRGDDDDNNDQKGDSPTPINGSASWTSRGGQTKRGGTNSGSMEQRTKSNEKWILNDDRSNFETNQKRTSGWRTNSSTSESDLNSRRPPIKRETMPEWMNDDNDDPNDLNNATFDQDGTFTRTSINQQNSNEQEKPQSKSTSNESLTQINSISSQQENDNKSEKTLINSDKTVVNVSATSEPIASQLTPPVQQSISSLYDDFDHNDVLTTVVESTLADDPDYSPPISTHLTSHMMQIEPTPQIIPQQRTTNVIDDKQWYYKDPQNTIQGPFSSSDMERWYNEGYFHLNLPVKRVGDAQFSTIQQLAKELGRFPFGNDVQLTSVPKQQSILSESQKYNPMTYASSKTAYLDEYLMQQQQSRQHQLAFNRQMSMPLSTNDRKLVSPEFQTYFNPQQQSTSSRYSSTLVNDPAIIYQQQLQRTVSSTVPQQTNSMFYDDSQRSLRQPTSTTNSSFYPSNISMGQHRTNDIMTRLNQAMQTYGKQHEKFDEQRRFEQQQQRDLELELLKIYQQAEQERLQRQEEDRRKYEQQDFQNQRHILFDQLTKSMENKNQSSIDIDPSLAYQQSILLQKKEQQAKLEAQQAENIRRYQQKFQEQSQQSMYKRPDTTNWTRHSSQNQQDLIQPLNYLDIQKQEQEKERRAHEAAAFAQQYTISETLSIPNSSSPLSSTKSNSWARTLFAGSNNANSPKTSTSTHILSDHKTNENKFTDSSSIAAYNQQATNAVLSLLNIHPKTRPVNNQQTTAWNGTNNVSNASFQDIQRKQQTQNEIGQQQSHHMTTGHSSTPVWTGNFQQSPSTLYWDNQHSSSLSNKPTEINSNKSSISWTEIKSSLSPVTPGAINSNSKETIKTENDTKCLSIAARTQDALSKWTQIQFKDISKEIDGPTLVQLLKDINNAGEIIEYVQPYIGSVSKAKEFAHDFLTKRNQLSNVEPDLDNERFNELVMAPISSNDNSISDNDDGFQLASSNGQKKKSKKNDKSKNRC